jgi:arabinose-5-phosphate isomerase
MTLLVEKGFRAEDFANLHPGGKLGKRLLRVEQVMQEGTKAPIVDDRTPMREVIFEISQKGLGMTAVIRNGRLAGIITDGDLRRRMADTPDILALAAADVMTRDPVTITRELLAVEALNLMERRKITSVIVAGADGVVEGVVHLHDLWRTELI